MNTDGPGCHPCQHGGVHPTDQLAARTERALATATEAGRELGLTVERPTVLYDVFSVVVHLAPAPVVVRVPTVLPRTIGGAAADLAAQADQQRRELAVAGWLAKHGHPVVAPSPLVAAEPVRSGGFSMTFWTFVEQLPDAVPGAERAAELTAELHAALRGYPGELPLLWPLDASIPDGFDQLDNRPDLLSPDDLVRARREWAVLEPLVSCRDGFATEFPDASLQPIHGDAPFYNIIVTAEGELSSDFEHATFGPVEWDLAGVTPEGLAAYDKAAVRLGLRPVDHRLLRVMESARAMQLVACLPMAEQLPMLVEGLAPFLGHWRSTPLAGGLG